MVFTCVPFVKDPTCGYCMPGSPRTTASKAILVSTVLMTPPETLFRPSGLSAFFLSIDSFRKFASGLAEIDSVVCLGTFEDEDDEETEADGGRSKEVEIGNPLEGSGLITVEQERLLAKLLENVQEPEAGRLRSFFRLSLSGMKETVRTSYDAGFRIGFEKGKEATPI